MANYYIDLEAGSPNQNGQSYAARAGNATQFGNLGSDNFYHVGYQPTSIGNYKWKSHSYEDGYNTGHNRINISQITTDATGHRNRWVVTCSSSHYLNAGDYVIISGTSNSLIEGLIKVEAVTSSTQFYSYSASGYNSYSGSSTGGYLTHANNRVVRTTSGSPDTTRVLPLLDCGPNASSWISYGSGTGGLIHGNNYQKHWATSQLIGIRQSGFNAYMNIYDTNGNTSSINTGSLQQLNWSYVAPNSSSYIRYYTNNGYSNYGSGQLRVYLYDQYNLSGNYIEYWWPWNGNKWSSGEIYDCTAPVASYNGNYSNRYPTNFNIRSIGIYCTSYAGNQDIYVSGFYLSKARNVQSNYYSQWSYNGSSDDCINNFSEIQDSVGQTFAIDGVTRHGDIILGGSYKKMIASGCGSQVRDGYGRRLYGTYYYKCTPTNWSYYNNGQTYETFYPSENTWVTNGVIRSQYWSGSRYYQSFNSNSRQNLYGGYRHNESMNTRVGKTVVTCPRGDETFWFSQSSHAFFISGMSFINFFAAIQHYYSPLSSDLYIYDSNFHGCQYGIYFPQNNWSSTAYNNGLYIYNCDFSCLTGLYMSLTGSSDAADIQIIDCIFKGNSRPVNLNDVNVNFELTNYFYGHAQGDLNLFEKCRVTQVDNGGLFVQGNGAVTYDNNPIIHFSGCGGVGIDLFDVRVNTGMYSNRNTTNSWPLSNTRCLKFSGSNVKIRYHQFYGTNQADILNHSSDIKIGYAAINDSYTSNYLSWLAGGPYYGQNQTHGGIGSAEEYYVNGVAQLPIWYHHNTGLAQKETTIVDGASSTASLMIEGGLISKYTYPNTRDIGSVAVDGTAPVTVNLRVYPTSTYINYRLVVDCNPQAGILTTLKYNLNVGNTLNTWNDQSVTFYPPNAGIVDLKLEVYDYTPGGSSGTQRVYFDNITFS